MRIPRLLFPLVFAGSSAAACDPLVFQFYSKDDTTSASSSSGVGGAGGAGGAGTGGTSSSAGTGGACMPGETAFCYDGPSGTQGVGICKPGTQTCAEDGSGFGPCVGAVKPLPVENCATTDDDDCDGKAPACIGNHIWSKRARDGSGLSVATDGAGNVLVTGASSGTADFGGGPIAGGIFIAKFDAAGNYLWAKGFGNGSGSGVTVDGAGNVLVTGYLSGTADFGGGPLVSKGANDVFVAKLDAAGNYLWARSFGDAQEQNGQSIAVDGLGNVLVTGSLTGSVDFGGGALKGTGGFSDVFVVKLDAAGNYLWAKSFGDAQNQNGWGIAVDGAGNVLVTGNASGTVDFGGGPLVTSGAFLDDVFVAKFDAAGNYLWAKIFGNASVQQATGIAVDGAGNVLVTGFFYETIDFGGGPLTSTGSADIFVAKLDASGSYLWAKAFGDADNQYANGVAVDVAGNVLATGYFFGAVNFGGGALDTAGGIDIFVVKLDAAGGYLWARRFGDEKDQQGRGIATDDDGNVLVTGFFQGTVDFGGNALTATGFQDIFIAKLGQ